MDGRSPPAGSTPAVPRDWSTICSLKTPVAVGLEAAVFVYIDPGMGTRTVLDSWRHAHRPLGQALRECGWRVEVVAVAWEQELLDRAERVLQSWIGRDLTEAGRELLILRWAASNADREAVERHGASMPP